MVLANEWYDRQVTLESEYDTINSSNMSIVTSTAMQLKFAEWPESGWKHNYALYDNILLCLEKKTYFHINTFDNTFN